VTPSVLRWAIEQSGYKTDDLAHAIGVQASALEAWASGDTKPTLTELRKLATKLHRPLATFLLPAPPAARPLSVQFRQPTGHERELNPSERRHLRRGARLQETLSWLVRELQLEPPRLPSASLNGDPASVPGLARQLLKVSPTTQKEWSTPSIAFDEWRAALERIGIIVFLFSLGKDSCRGFSLPDDFAPVIAVNTAWNESARIFTLFHELGHLITRTSSACVETTRTTSGTDPVERWCERFAADALMPMRDVAATLAQNGWRPGAQITSLELARRVARVYNVSLRAAVIRLIELDAATWSLYNEIPPISDSKPAAGGGSGRNRFQIREDQLGQRVTSLIVSAVEREILSRSQGVEFLDIPDVAFDELAPIGRRTS
jgi:Zn-dependent peptidase ImmA (M78 family)/transcriptional regulator with XRE-family HTH domain